MPESKIYLKEGHDFKGKGFGVKHIWAQHKNDLIRLNYPSINSVSLFVANITKTGANIFYEQRIYENQRVNVLETTIGIVVIEFNIHQQIYSVVTAYPRKSSRGTLVGTLL